MTPTFPAAPPATPGARPCWPCGPRAPWAGRRAPAPVAGTRRREGPERTISEWLTRMHEASRSAATSAPSSSPPAPAGCPARASGTPATARARSTGSRPLGRAALHLPPRRRGAHLPARHRARCAANGASPWACSPSCSIRATPPFPSSMRPPRRQRPRGRLRRRRRAAAPKDALRFGYRIWSEKKSGLVVKLQTLDATATCWSRPRSPNCSSTRPCASDKLAQMMAVPEGWRVEKPDAVKTTAAAEGWA
jgi:sigma-E factor negative regulatory protein RseB